MTFRELINGCSFKSVFNKIQSLYYEDATKEKLEGASYNYRKVYDLLARKPNNDNDDWKIYITEKEEDGEKYIDVCYYNEVSDEIFAIDFVSWSDLIDLEIYHCVQLDNTTTLAHILWEITFYGFNEESLAEAKKSLDIK